MSWKNEIYSFGFVFFKMLDKMRYKKKKHLFIPDLFFVRSGQFTFSYYTNFLLFKVGNLNWYLNLRFVSPEKVSSESALDFIFTNSILSLVEVIRSFIDLNFDEVFIFPKNWNCWILVGISWNCLFLVEIVCF